MVPMGQNEHQALGANHSKENGDRCGKKAYGYKDHAYFVNYSWVCTNLKIINPMRMMKIGTLIHMLLRVKGISNLRLNGLSQKSTKLPLGQRLPQNHLPLKGAIIMSVAKTSRRK